MNPPFVSPPLTPSISNISAQFDYLNGSNSDSASRYSAKASLGGISQSPRRSTQHNGSFESATLKAFHWAKLLSSRQNDDIRRTSSSFIPQQSDSQAIPSLKSTAQSCLLSAQSVESLPHYALPHQDNDLVSRAPPAHTKSDPTTLENHPASTHSQSGHLASAESVPPRWKISLSLPHDTPNCAPNLHRHPATRKNSAGIYHGPVSRELSGFANFGVAAAEERWRKGERSEAESIWTQQGVDESTFDTPSDDSGWSDNILQGTGTKSDPPVTTRRKAHLSEPRNTQNSSPILTVNNRGQHAAGIYSEWICRERSGFANPTVAAAKERWQKSAPTPFQNSNNPPHEAEVDATTRRPGLSEPLNTPNSSPHLHFRDKNSAGVHSEWICRESFGFASPTDAASRQRWGITDEREGKGRWNGLPSVNSWDMTKSHVLGQTNCFDGFGNGFGMGGRIMATGTEGGRTGGRLPSNLFDGVQLSASGSGGNGEESSKGGGSGGDRAEYVMPDSKVKACFACMPDRIATFGQATQSHRIARPGDGIGNYPVPAGLIVASREAQRSRTIDDARDKCTSTVQADRSGPSSDRDKRRIARGNALGLRASGRPRPTGFGESNGVSARNRREKGEYALPQSLHDVADESEELAGDSANTDNNGSPAFFRDLDYRQQRNYRGSVWPQRSSAPHDSGFGEGNGVPTGERTERKDKGLAAERRQSGEVEASQLSHVNLERDRRIKGSHLPLRVAKGNVNGLRCSQARSHGFGERNGCLPRDDYEQVEGCDEEDESDRDEDNDQEPRARCDRSRWTRSTGFGLCGERGAWD